MLLEGLGIEGDVHSGITVKHRSRVAKNPNAPNLRQVHLIHFELLEELRSKGFNVEPGIMGENISTKGIELLKLSEGTKLQLGNQAVIEIKGLRNPCVQLEGIQKGLMQAVLDKDARGNLIRKAGVMGIVLKGGIVNKGDEITILNNPNPFKALEKV